MRLRLTDTTLFFDTAGTEYVVAHHGVSQRPTLIVLHGGPGLFDHTYLKPCFSELRDVAYVIFLDLRGHGRSDRGRPNDWCTLRWAEDVHKFCSALGLCAPVIVGHSFGGFVAQRVATLFPTAISGLILLNTAARFRLDWAASAIRLRGGDRARAAFESLFAEFTPDHVADFAETCLPLYNRRGQQIYKHLEHCISNPEVFRHVFRRGGEAAEFDTREQLHRVRCRTLVVSGGLDPLYHAELSEELVSSLPPGLVTHKRFEDCGHNIELDDPHGLQKCLRNFVANRPQRNRE